MLLPDWTAALRALLLDTSAPYLWPDAPLARCITDACTAYSYLFPRLVRTVYDVAAGQQEIALSPAAGLAPGSPPTPPPPGPAAADLIRVLGVELPPGLPLPEDAWPSTPAAPSLASRSPQGYRWTPQLLRLRVPAAGAEVGAGTLAVVARQTWDTPTAAAAWNGPPSADGLVLLLAQRRAYGLLAGWQARAQGTAPATIPSGSSNSHIDLPPLLAALEIEIKREIEARQAAGG